MKTNLPGLLLAFLFFTQFSQAQSNSVSFDGTDDYIDCGNNALLAATNIRTITCWVKFNTLAGEREIVSKSMNSQGIELLLINGNLSFYLMRDPANASFIEYNTSGLTTGRWYHLAVTWSGTRESMRLYVDGRSVGSRIDIGNINTGITNPSGSFRIGQWADAGINRSFSGTIDEVRVWSIERTNTELIQSRFRVPSTTTGLIAYWDMDETSGPTVTNLTPNAGLDGTLTNGAARVISPAQYASNAIDIDGSNDYITIPANAAYDIATGTVEFWARANTLAVGNEKCMLGVRGTGGARYSFHLTPNHIGFWNGSNYYTFDYSFTAGTWYHFAFVCNGAQTLIHVNGQQVGAFNALFGSANGQPLIIGRVIEATQFEPFDGAIDELRIWNVQRAEAEIEATYNRSLHGDEAGLVGLFRFDYGITAGDNAAMITAFDRTINSNHGALVNFTLNGTTSNFVSNPLVPLPVKFAWFTASQQNGQTLLRWQTAQEQNSDEFIIERSADDNAYESIGRVAAAGNSNSAINYIFIDKTPATGKNYYRLKQTDLDGQFMYSATRQIDFAKESKLYWYATSSNTVEVRLENGDAEQYKITDSRGSVIRTGRLNNGRGRLQGLPAGTYYLSIIGAGPKTVRFLVQ